MELIANIEVFRGYEIDRLPENGQFVIRTCPKCGNEKMRHLKAKSQILIMSNKECIVCVRKRYNKWLGD